MVKMSRKNSLMLVAAVLLVIGTVLTGGCAASKAGTPTQITKDVIAWEALNLIQDNKGNPDFVILDVRTPEEFAEGHLENAVNLDYNSATFRDELAQLDRDKKYLMHCRSGNRSSKALEVMKELDFREVYHMAGGTIEWEEAGLPLVK